MSGHPLPPTREKPPQAVYALDKRARQNPVSGTSASYNHPPCDTEATLSPVVVVRWWVVNAQEIAIAVVTNPQARAQETAHPLRGSGATNVLCQEKKPTDGKARCGGAARGWGGIAGSCCLETVAWAPETRWLRLRTFWKLRETHKPCRQESLRVVKV